MSEILQNGTSVQYGRQRTGLPPTVHYNFITYPDGEVQVRGSEGSIILDEDAFLTLLGLFSKSTGRSLIALPAYIRNDGSKSGMVTVLDDRAIASLDLYVNAAISTNDGRVWQIREV